jgi:hypothetical protein
VNVISSYRPRLADLYLSALFADFPAVMITGARAAGKTTTAAQHVEQIVRLDQPGVAAAYRDIGLVVCDHPTRSEICSFLGRERDALGEMEDVVRTPLPLHLAEAGEVGTVINVRPVG